MRAAVVHDQPVLARYRRLSALQRNLFVLMVALAAFPLAPGFAGH